MPPGGIPLPSDVSKTLPLTIIEINQKGWDVTTLIRLHYVLLQLARGPTLETVTAGWIISFMLGKLIMARHFQKPLQGGSSFWELRVTFGNSV